MNLSVLPASYRQSKPSCRRDVGSTLACGSWSRCMIRESLTLFMNDARDLGKSKFIRKGGVDNVARANSQTDLALFLRWLSVQT
jgi:hypothetical protein